jgi:hypothetical protein
VKPARTEIEEFEPKVNRLNVGAWKPQHACLYTLRRLWQGEGNAKSTVFEYCRV